MTKEQKKKLTIGERLTNGMTAMDLPPGSLVQLRGRRELERLFFSRRTKPEDIDTVLAKDYYEMVEVDFHAYMLYLGVETLGPRVVIDPGRRRQILRNTIYVHQFLHGERVLNLEISRPDRYYTIFRRYFKRTDKKNNFCR